MPLYGTEFALLEDHPLGKLAAVERLLATPQQWCQGKIRDEQDRHCLVGAMEAAQARQVLEPVILRAVRQVAGKRYWRVEFFNDDPRTTHADVLRVLRRARDNIIHSTIDDRRRSWRQTLADLWRALRAGSVAQTYAVLGRDGMSRKISLRPHRLRSPSRVTKPAARRCSRQAGPLSSLA